MLYTKSRPCIVCLFSWQQAQNGKMQLVLVAQCNSFEWKIEKSSRINGTKCLSTKPDITKCQISYAVTYSSLKTCSPITQRCCACSLSRHLFFVRSKCEHKANMFWLLLTNAEAHSIGFSKQNAPYSKVFWCDPCRRQTPLTLCILRKLRGSYQLRPMCAPSMPNVNVYISLIFHLAHCFGNGQLFHFPFRLHICAHCIAKHFELCNIVCFVLAALLLFWWAEVGGADECGFVYLAKLLIWRWRTTVKSKQQFIQSPSLLPVDAACVVLFCIAQLVCVCVNKCLFVWELWWI